MTVLDDLKVARRVIGDERLRFDVVQPLSLLGTPVIESRVLEPRDVLHDPLRNVVYVGDWLQFRFRLDVQADLAAVVRAAEARLFGASS